MRVEHLLLLVVAQLTRQLGRAAERILDPGQPFDEAGAPLEELRKLLDAQLPR